jgi:hypothetical protein
MINTTMATSRDVPVYLKRYTTVTIWRVSSGKPVATGTLLKKFKNGIQIVGCHEGLGADQDLSVKTYLDGEFAFTWE